MFDYFDSLKSKTFLTVLTYNYRTRYLSYVLRVRLVVVVPYDVLYLFFVTCYLSLNLIPVLHRFQILRSKPNDELENKMARKTSRECFSGPSLHPIGGRLRCVGIGHKTVKLLKFRYFSVRSFSPFFNPKERTTPTCLFPPNARPRTSSSSRIS